MIDMDMVNGTSGGWLSFVNLLNLCVCLCVKALTSSWGMWFFTAEETTPLPGIDPQDDNYSSLNSIDFGEWWVFFVLLCFVLFCFGSACICRKRGGITVTWDDLWQEAWTIIRVPACLILGCLISDVREGELNIWDIKLNVKKVTTADFSYLTLKTVLQMLALFNVSWFLTKCQTWQTTTTPKGIFTCR